MCEVARGVFELGGRWYGLSVADDKGELLRVVVPRLLVVGFLFERERLGGGEGEEVWLFHPLVVARHVLGAVGHEPRRFSEEYEPCIVAHRPTRALVDCFVAAQTGDLKPSKNPI